jgi:predicted metal-binding protein
MRSSNATKTAASSCAANNRTCNGVCSGYGTQPECPPLIVLAVLATPAPR